MTVTLTQTDIAKGIAAMPYPDDAGDLVAQRASVTIPASGAGAAANDIYEMLVIPANCTVIDAILDSDDLDSNGTPTLTLDVGLMSGTPGDNDNTRTVGQELFAGSTVAQAGGLARPTAKTAARIATSSSPRSVGVKIANAAATGVAGTLGLTLLLATRP